MSRDGLLPAIFARLTRAADTGGHDAHVRRPDGDHGRARCRCAEIAKLVNIGTLFAFLIVNIGVIILRRTQPDLERGFRVPFVPVFPLIGAVLCIYLMSRLELVTWLRFGGWLLLGFVIYFAVRAQPLAPAARRWPGRGARRALGVARAAARGACSVPGRR